MKRLYFLILSVLVMGQSAFGITINCTAGGLNLAAVSSGLYTATDLKVTGTMDSRDFTFIQYYVPLLTTLDLSSVTIAAYSVNPANTIPAGAFTPVPPNNYTKNLTTITLPSSITAIGTQAFYGCTGLATVNIPSTVLISIGTGAFYSCTNLTSINIPSSVSSLGASAFFGCTNLTSITIPSSVTTIGNAVLSGCTGLITLNANGITPVDLSASLYAFNNVSKTNCTLHVPVGAKSAYQSAVVWQDFLNILEGSTEILNLKSSSICLYPNPVSVGFSIKGFEGRASIDITDLNGKIVFTKQVSNNDYISVSSLPCNLYFVKITTESETVVIKLMKD